jgi:uncharacterized membrane protein YccC
MGAVSMIVFPETVSRSLIKLVQATDAKLSKFLSACLSLVSDYSGRNRALRKLTANALAIENLRHGFAFEEIGDERVAAIAVLRVFVAVGVGSLFWFATAWPAGDTFLIWIAIGACRFVIAPNPGLRSGNYSKSCYSASVVTAAFGTRHWFAWRYL